ncbi:MAG: FkbM family methyltransferase [Abyssibacter sp.]|nr:FkbM family methyltransferase [Abyssibacter sp.]MCK5857885.1 FkbM family methyltransferase [Abyssibacter sp.]
MPAWRTALRRQGVAAGVEHAGVMRNPGPVRTVVDIGANRGQFALVARYCFRDARIVSFEPLTGPAALWRAVFASDGLATLEEAAVGPQAVDAEIHVSARDDSSSLLPIAARQSALFPGTAEAGTATIRVQRLADALPAEDIAALVDDAEWRAALGAAARSYAESDLAQEAIMARFEQDAEALVGGASR